MSATRAFTNSASSWRRVTGIWVASARATASAAEAMKAPPRCCSREQVSQDGGRRGALGVAGLTEFGVDQPNRLSSSPPHVRSSAAVPAGCSPRGMHAFYV